MRETLVVRSSARRLLAATASLLWLAGCEAVTGGLSDRATDNLANPVTVKFQNGVSPSASYAGTQDTMLEEATPSTNYGSAKTLVADQDYPDGTGKRASAILSFDLSSVPAGSKVTAATLTLNVTNPTGGSYNLYAIKRSWEDESSTWASALSGESWQTPGALGAEDRGTTVLGTVATKVTGKVNVTLNAAGVALMQQWVDTPSVPTALIIDSPSNMDGLQFDSSEATTASNRPALSITYTPSSTPSPGTGTGLLADYYGGTALSGSKLLTRTDATVNFDWAAGSPASAVPADNFSVRWQGQVQPLYTGTYTFYTRSDDGVRLWVNGQELINNWTAHSAVENSGTISLTAGQKYDLKMEYFERTGQAVAQLSWSSASQAKQVIPETQLYPATSTTPPPSGASPIKYILVIIKENHTFDNYFAGFPGADTSLTAKLSNGTTLTRPQAPKSNLPRDLCHAHSCATTALNGGAMNGFDKVSGASSNGDNLTFIHYAESQIPNYWQYARHFVLADHVFSTTLGPSFPGHFATVAGFNYGLSNPACACGGTCTIPVYDPNTCNISQQVPCWDAPSVVQELPTGYTWGEYGWSMMVNIKPVTQIPNYKTHLKTESALLTDIQNNTMPNLMYAHLTAGPTGEHPPSAVCPGENQTVTILNALMKSPHWKETAVILMWDDWGGFYDSVAPPASKCANGDYMRPGFRIPMMIISPYAKPGYVLKTPAEQASVLKLIEDLWNLPRLSTKDSRIRDESSGSLLGAFDFTQTPNPALILNTRTCP